MRHSLFLSLLGLLLLAAIAQGEDSSVEEPAEGINYSEAFVLGLVEGITEYLPISSTGHLILTNRLLGLDVETPMVDRNGVPVMRIEDGEEKPFTLKNATDAYVIIIQGGAIIAVVILYWRRLWTIALGILGKDPNGLLLLRNLVVAFLPAAFLGLLLDDWIESKLFGVGPVLVALMLGAFLMFAVEYWRKKKRGPASAEDIATSGPDLHELNIPQCLTIGFLQCVAMWPGTSRSMMTIVGGYVVGLNPVRAAEFSFLLGLVTLTAASGYKLLDTGEYMLQTLDLGPVLFGIFVATISAALAVRWLVNYLTKHGLAIFAWYRIILAVALGIYFFA